MSKKLNLSKSFYIGDALRIWINLGWYWGEEFKLLELTLLNVCNEFYGYEFSTLFQVQVAKFVFGFGYEVQK